MAKKDFTNINMDRVYRDMDEATAEQETPRKYKPRKTYTEQEKHDIMETRKTNGCKGLKLPRINMAFTPSIYDYIRTMARVQGITITDYVNNILEQHMKDHDDIYQKALEFRRALDGEL